MQKQRGQDPRIASPEPALRIFMRRLRQIMAEPSDGQARLDTIVRQVAGHMVADVCSIYLKRQDGSLELFATEGLNPAAKHITFMMRGEGLVGLCAHLAQPVNEPDAQNHPSFSYRPETGEEIYHSLLAVPVSRGGSDVLGVLVVQNRTERLYSDDDVEAAATPCRVGRCWLALSLDVTHLTPSRLVHSTIGHGTGCLIIRQSASQCECRQRNLSPCRGRRASAASAPPIRNRPRRSTR